MKLQLSVNKPVQESRGEHRIFRSSFYNNPFLGLFFKASDKLLVAPANCPKNTLERMQAALGVPVLHTFLAQSSLIGIFCVLNSSGAVVSSLAESAEKRLLKKQGLNLFSLDTLSPGNNVVANDRAALASPGIPKPQAKKIGDCLGVEVFQQRFATPRVITSTVATNKGLLVNNDFTETETKFLEKIFGVKGSQATVNNGAAFNSLGVAANSRGAVVGEATSGFELQRIYEALFG